MLTDRLRAAIRQSGLTHYQLGKQSNTSPSVIDRFVTEERDLYLSTASRLAKAVGLDLTPIPTPTNNLEKKERKSQHPT